MKKRYKQSEIAMTGKPESINTFSTTTCESNQIMTVRRTKKKIKPKQKIGHKYIKLNMPVNTNEYEMIRVSLLFELKFVKCK